MVRRGTWALAISMLLLAAPQAHGLQANEQFVLGAENNRLNAFDAATHAKRTVIPSEADDPVAGLDINAEICFVPDTAPWKPAGETWFIAGEDTEQNSIPGVVRQGWGLFRLTGATLATLHATEVGKLVPNTFVTTTDNPENYGCGVLPDGRIITGDVGDQQPLVPATGQLIEWFPTAAMFQGPIGPGRTDFAPVPYCKIDVGVGTAGGAAVDGTNVLFTSNRPNLQTGALGGVYKYDSRTWPTGPSAAAGCGRTDARGDRLANADRVGRSLFIPQSPLALTPSDIVRSPRGTWYVSSVFSGTITEFSRSGLPLRIILLSAGQLGQPGLIPQLNGITPYGMGVTRDGAIWVADIGVVGTAPAAAGGSVARIPIGSLGQGGAPQIIDDGLEFPDGIGIYTPKAPSLRAGGPSSARTAAARRPRRSTHRPSSRHR